MNIYYQEGGQEMGQEEQLMQLFQAFADIVQDDEFNTAEEVMQMFMELAPEEQQAFVQQAIQIIQQEQGEQEVESNPEEELMEQQEVQPMMQQGGINPQKIQQILQAYASSIGEDPNVILQQFQQMQPEEQQQALQQIVQQLQGGQMQEQQQMQDGGYVNNTGYLDGYESSNNPYNIIPSNRITMEGVRPDIQYIKGTDNLGNTQYMEHGGEYKFDGDFVVEEPVYAQTGEDLQDSYQYKQQRGEVIKKLLKNPNIPSSERSILTTELVKNAKDLKQLETKIQNVPKINETKLNEIKQAKKVQAAKKAIEQTTAERIAKSKGVLNTPLTEQQVIVADDAFNLAKKETPIPFYERMRQAKIDKGISTGVIKPVPNVNLSIGNIGEVALQKLSNGSTEVLNQLKKLKIQNPNIKIADLKKYVPKVNVTNALKGLGAIGTAATLYDVYDQFSNLDNPNYILTDRGVISKEEYETERNQKPISLKDLFSIDEKEAKKRLDARIKATNNQNDRNALSLEEIKSGKSKNPYNLKTELDYKRIFAGNVVKDIPKTTSANQDKPKIKLPDKRTKAALSETEKPFVLQPSPVPTEIPEQQDTFDYRQPLIIDSRFEKYSIPEEDRTVELNPNVFNRSNVGVGKRFFNQTGGYNYAQDGFKPRKFKSEIDFNSRLNPGSSMNMGAKSDGDFEYAYPDKKKAYFVNGTTQLDPINQYDTMPMGANSMNYEAPNTESMKMWNRGSDRILDLANYADRFGVEHFGANTKPISDQNVNRRSKFQQFMDKYGEKSDFRFKNNARQIAPLYNLLQSYEPIAPVYRPQMDIKYAEKPMVDPRPFIQELQNQYALSSRNINSNSPTGMAWQSNLQAKMKAGVEDILNKTSATNQQIAAENELSRINAFNQEQQLNIGINQQALATQAQRQAIQSTTRGKAYNDIDAGVANKEKMENYYTSLPLYLDDIELSKNPLERAMGITGFNKTKNASKYYSPSASTKTLSQIQAEERLRKAAQLKASKLLEQQQEIAQTGGKINDFFRKRY